MAGQSLSRVLSMHQVDEEGRWLIEFYQQRGGPEGARFGMIRCRLESVVAKVEFTDEQNQL